MRKAAGLGCLTMLGLFVATVAVVGPGNFFFLVSLAKQFGPTIAMNAVGLGPWEDGEAVIVAVYPDMSDRYRTQGQVTLAYTDDQGVRRTVQGEMVRFMNASEDELPKVGDAEVIRFCKADRSILASPRFVIAGSDRCANAPGGG